MTPFYLESINLPCLGHEAFIELGDGIFIGHTGDIICKYAVFLLGSIDGCESGAKLTVAAKSMASLGAASISLACAVMPESLAVSSAAFLDFIYCAKKAQKFVNTAFYYKTKLIKIEHCTKNTCAFHQTHVSQIINSHIK